MIDAERIAAHLGKTLAETDFVGLGERYHGKVRDCYIRDQTRLLVATDRLSAFDKIITTLPFKGQVLNRLSAFWFDKTKGIAPNHLLGVPDPNVSEVIDCVPLPVEMVVRAYVTGVTPTSIWTAYARGERVFCGHPLPEGLKKNDPLGEPIVTPSTKAPKGERDQSGSRDEILAATKGRLSAADFDRAAEMALALFRAGVKHCASEGLVLVDTKYEFGKTPDGRIVVIDEIHTPDSSRFWFLDSYREAQRSGTEPEGLDKEYVRRHLAGRGYTGEGLPPPVPDDVRVEAARRYIEAYERIVGEPFEPNLEEPLWRIAQALGLNPTRPEGLSAAAVAARATGGKRPKGRSR